MVELWVHLWNAKTYVNFILNQIHIVSEEKCFAFENGLSHGKINWQTKVSMVFGEIQNVNCQISDPMTSLAAIKEILSS